MKRYLIANNDNLAGSVEWEVLAIILLFMGILSFLLTFGYTTTYLTHPVFGASQFSAISRTTPSLPSNIKIDITSAHRVNGIAGQFIKIDGVILRYLSHQRVIA